MHERQYVIDDITVKDNWRMFLIMAEFVEGFEEMPEVYPAVSIFGSARSHPNSSEYRHAEKMAETFLKGYADTIALSELKNNASQICRLQRKNIRKLASQKPTFRAAGFVCHQMLMNVRLHRFLQRYEAGH